MILQLGLCHEEVLEVFGRYINWFCASRACRRWNAAVGREYRDFGQMGVGVTMGIAMVHGWHDEAVHVPEVLNEAGDVFFGVESIRGQH